MIAGYSGNYSAHRRGDSSIESQPTAVRRGRGLCLLVATALWTAATYTTPYAQTAIGSPTAGFQHWTVGNLNNNGAPFWDAPSKSFGFNKPNFELASKNVGFCLTGTGDCVGIGSHSEAPGPLPYWGMPFNSIADSGGAIDPKVYFHRQPLSR